MHTEVKGRPNMSFSFDLDLDLDPVTLILKLDMVMMYLYTENEVPSFGASKVIASTDRQTQTNSTEIITYPHTRMVIT